MRRENKNPRKILFSVLIAIAFVVLAGIKLGYANIISPKQGINEYHFYNDTIENKDSAKEIQKQIILDGKEISDPGHVFKDKDKVLLKWQDEEGNDIEFDTPIEIKGNDKKIINVYPVFKNQVVITYYISGSTNDRVYMTDTINDASSYKLPVDPTIYDANKYFVNWSETKDGKSGVYDEESLKKDIAAGKTDIKLYAITEFKHKATFITGDGASFQDQILADDGGKLDKMPEKPTRAGYEFSHWSLTEDGDPVDLNTLVLDKDINVYAVWKPVVVDYKFKVMVQNINDDGYTFHEIISARGLISCILLFPNINPSSKYVNSFNGVRSDILLYPKFKYFNLVKFLTTSISFILKFNSKFNLSSLVRLARGSIFVILLSPKLRISRFTKLDNGVRSDTGLSFITILVNLVKLDIGFKSDILL